MKKPRILWLSEFHHLNTGYATYSREILKRLHAYNEFDIAEFAAYAHDDDNRVYSAPWKVYSNIPSNSNEQAKNQYGAEVANQFGAWRFNEVCLDWAPSVVCTIRDYWMDVMVNNSPYRPFFYWVWMPTCDSPSQNREWIDTFSKVDTILTYQDWSGKTLLEESGNSIYYSASAPPAAAEEFKPLNKQHIKNQLGLGQYKIVGTVMRNQRRKLFPDLFAAFRDYLNESKRTDVILYCHTSYPDQGWNLPELLNEYGLNSRVLFTYVCKNCNNIFPAFFQDSITTCQKCNSGAVMANVQDGAPNHILSAIYNIFDLYVQMCSAEGAGMPVWEAAACGVPVAAVNHSALMDPIEKLKCYSINPVALSKEVETGCLRAVPKRQDLTNILHSFFNLTEEERSVEGKRIYRAYLKEYGTWDKSAETWANVIRGVNHDEYSNRWLSPPRIYLPAKSCPQNMSNTDFARWIIVEVLREPDKIGTLLEARLVRDLNNGVTNQGMFGMYYNEHSALFGRQQFMPFSREIAYDHFCKLAERRNHYEAMRKEKFKL